jgi:hypothetical protein
MADIIRRKFSKVPVRARQMGQDGRLMSIKEAAAPEN